MYDLIVIGAGPAGVQALNSALDKGWSVLLFEEKDPGGTCLNRGCIPTKYLMKHIASAGSIEELVQAKTKLISSIAKSLESSILKSGVEIIKAKASFKDSNTVTALGNEYTAKNIIIATGSSAKKIDIEGNVCLSPEELLASDLSFKSYLIVGGGVIGVEFAFLLSQLGKKVTIVEKEDDILIGLDREMVKKLRSLLKRSKVNVLCGEKSKTIEYSAYECIVTAVGRSANTKDLKLANAGIDNYDGWINTDADLRTSQKHIYACGDVRGDKLYAYTAEAEAKSVVEKIADSYYKHQIGLIPSCVFANVSLACVGATEEELLEANIDYNKKVSNFIAYASAHVYDDKQGVIKILYDEHGKVLGAHILSRFAAELIGYFTLAIQGEIPINKLKNTLFLHPTIAEIIAKIWD